MLNICIFYNITIFNVKLLLKTHLLKSTAGGTVNPNDLATFARSKVSMSKTCFR